MKTFKNILILIYILIITFLVIFLPTYIEDQTYIGIFATFEKAEPNSKADYYIQNYRDEFLFLDVKKDYDEFILIINRINPTKKKLILHTYIHNKNKTVYKPKMIEVINNIINL
jgi:hypothetical protein